MDSETFQPIQPLYESASFSKYLSQLLTAVFLCVLRSEQQQRSASREGAKHQHELELWRRKPGGDQHLHRKEAGLRDAITALQALHVRPLAEAAAAGGSEADATVCH